MLLVVVVACVCAPAASAGSGFFFGLSADSLKNEGSTAAKPARAMGARAFRITLTWTPGRSALSFSDVVNVRRAVTAWPGLKLAVAVYGTAASAPTTATARDQYCRYARSVLTSFPSITDIVIWNEPNSGRFWRPQYNPDGSSAAPAAYEALLARCWDLLHQIRASANLIAPATAPQGNDNPAATTNLSHSPGAFIRKLGDAYRASGRRQRILDTVGHHAYGDSNAERPWRRHIGTKTIAQGDWNKLMSNLAAAFSGTAQPIPGQCTSGRCVSIMYMEGGFETVPDAAKAGFYEQPNEPGTIVDLAGGSEPDWPPPSADSPAPDQATQIRDAVRLAYCQPYVTAFFNFLLWDEARAVGWQSAAYWADRTPKDSLAAFTQVIAEANARTVACGLLKGGQPSADYTPPSTVTDLVVSVTGPPAQIDLAWSAATDAGSGIRGYRVYRDGAFYAWAAGTQFTDTAVTPGTSYTYTVFAQDGADNLGAVSNKVTVTTP